MTAFSEDGGIRIIGCAVPVELANLTRAAAKKDMTSMSDLMRKALVTELKARGVLKEETA